MKNYLLVILWKRTGEVEKIDLQGNPLEAYTHLKKREINFNEAEYFKLGLGDSIYDDNCLVFIQKSRAKKKVA